VAIGEASKVRFSDEDIAAARRLRELGLAWQPRVGHYVYDETSFCKKSSPFQPGVYFILNYDYFMGQVGGVDRFREIMLWLPTWHDAREILRTYAVSDEAVADELRRRQAIERQRELIEMYAMIADKLRDSKQHAEH
jgi:hypothetical protein